MEQDIKDSLLNTIDRWAERLNLDNERILVITPDATRSCPLDIVVPYLQERLLSFSCHIDYLVALGTHRTMSQDDIRSLYGVTEEMSETGFRGTVFFNHEWADEDTFRKIGEIPAAEMKALSRGYLTEPLEIKVNNLVYDYDRVLVLSPVFPHEVVGFSGGVKYFFPGVSGGDFVQKFHWLGGVLGSTNIIGKKKTETRTIIERAGEFLNLNVEYLTMVMGPGHSFKGAFSGSHDEAWPQAVQLSSEVNIKRIPRQFKTVIGIAPEMYDEIWTAGKVMYKLERMVAPGGRLIIYAPHIDRFSHTWGKWIEKVGYHTRDYLLDHPELMEGVPPGIFAQSCYVKGMGEYKDGIEYPRIDVVLCTAIPEALCHKVNLSYLDPQTFDPDLYRNREENGILVVDNAGEVLYLPEE